MTAGKLVKAMRMEAALERAGMSFTLARAGAAPLQVLIEPEALDAFSIKSLLKPLDLIHGNAKQRLEAFRVGDA